MIDDVVQPIADGQSGRRGTPNTSHLRTHTHRMHTKNRRSRAAGTFSSEADGTREEGKEGERRGKKRGRERSSGESEINNINSTMNTTTTT